MERHTVLNLYVTLRRPSNVPLRLPLVLLRRPLVLLLRPANQTSHSIQ